jgi:glycosyltransferase involved in cell wall biosynthesis
VIVSKGRETLNETIASILNQTLKPKEVLINFESDKNIYARWNKVIFQSTSEFFIPLCDDDLLATTFIEETLGIAEEKNKDCVYTNMQTFGEENGIHIPDKHPFFTTLYSKSIWEKTGGYIPQAGLYADALFGMMVWKYGTKYHLEKPLFLYRCHQEQITKELGNPTEASKLRKFIEAL